jgi:hypothetical protein
MTERPRSRYTRAKTWAALYSQHINACWAWIPNSATNNSIGLVKCATPEEAQTVQRALLKASDECEAYYSKKLTPDQAPELIKGRERHAIVLAKSSDYHHYHLAEYHQFRLVICGQHDSYLHLPVWETSTNRQYKARETAVPLTSSQFKAIRGTKRGHQIFLGALVSGDKDAIALRDDPTFLPERSRRRIITEVNNIQRYRYHGRPLAFLTEAEREQIGGKISTSLRLYHERKKAGL